MDSRQIRRLNVRQLAEEVGGVTALAGMTGTSQSYLSQIIGPHPSREVGEVLARRVEQATGRPHGWLDQSHVTDEKLTKARRVYDTLLQLPDAKIEAVMQLLDLALGSQQIIEQDVTLRHEPATTKRGRSRNR